MLSSGILDHVGGRYKGRDGGGECDVMGVMGCVFATSYGVGYEVMRCVHGTSCMPRYWGGGRHREEGVDIMGERGEHQGSTARVPSHSVLSSLERVTGQPQRAAERKKNYSLKKKNKSRLNTAVCTNMASSATTPTRVYYMYRAVRQ